METFLAGDFDEVPNSQHVSLSTFYLVSNAWCRRGDVLVGTDTGGFESFRGELFVFVRDHVHAEREFIDVSALAAEIEDADFGVGNTTVKAGFGVWR